MTIVEGETGVLVIDPLISMECAAAGLVLYQEHRGERPVTGLFYTHSHVDHFGGARGVVSAEDLAARRVQVLAPAGFLEHAVSENVYAGGAMTRRATYMYGALFPKGPAGQAGAGLGQTTSMGTVTLIAPTRESTHTGQEETIEGIRMVFQLTPGTEAPAEMNFLFPERRALCMAENATHNLHNVLTLRGAVVRDPHAWSLYLDEAIGCSPIRRKSYLPSIIGRAGERIGSLTFLEKQRDLYGYIHDQALRLLNKGYVASEIGEMLELPAELERDWHCHGYYGSLNHNLKAVYQRYLGWFDGNPAHLWPHPPEAAGERYVALAGGADALLTHARQAFDRGDFRWVAEVASHLVLAQPDNVEAKELQARALEQLANGAENGTWRNFFLMGAHELRHGAAGTAASLPPDFIVNLTMEQLVDALAIQIDGPRAGELASPCTGNSPTPARIIRSPAPRRPHPPPRRTGCSGGRDHHHPTLGPERGHRRVDEHRSDHVDRTTDDRRQPGHARRAPRPAGPTPIPTSRSSPHDLEERAPVGHGRPRQHQKAGRLLVYSVLVFANCKRLSPALVPASCTFAGVPASDDRRQAFAALSTRR